MNEYIPTKIIIENPDKLDYARFPLDFVREEALEVKRNSLRDKDQTCITDIVKIINCDEIEVIYNWPSRGDVKISAKIKGEILAMKLHLLKK